MPGSGTNRRNKMFFLGLRKSSQGGIPGYAPRFGRKRRLRRTMQTSIGEVATLQEVRQAIQSLSNQELMQLWNFAVWKQRAIPHGFGLRPEDLLQEAFSRMWGGRRPWKKFAIP